MAVNQDALRRVLDKAQKADEAVVAAERDVASKKAALERAKAAVEQRRLEAERRKVLVEEAAEYESKAGDRPSFAGLSYATEDELLAFANKIRKAGGADALSALMPSVASSPSACLIANALNFGCSVDGGTVGLDNIIKGPRGENRWVMHLSNDMPQRIVKKIANAVDCPLGQREHTILLPWHIGNAAHAFDNRNGWTAKYIKKPTISTTYYDEPYGHDKYGSKW